jgi:hypothetical protein
MVQNLAVARGHEPVDARIGERSPQGGGDRQPVDDVAERAEANEQDPVDGIHDGLDT